jgi:hypothetical protein
MMLGSVALSGGCRASMPCTHVVLACMHVALAPCCHFSCLHAKNCLALLVALVRQRLQAACLGGCAVLGCCTAGQEVYGGLHGRVAHIHAACMVRHMVAHAHAGHDPVACVSQGLQLGAGQGYCSWGLNNMHGAVGGSCGWDTYAAGSHAWKGLRVLKVFWVSCNVCRRL